jgi:hypothetical protein
MSIKQIIQESINRNPVGLKEALDEELRARVALALEAKMEDEDLEESHGVFRKGGSIGEKKPTGPIEVHDNPEDAKAHAKRLNAQLSPGEKKYYGIKYHVKPIKEGFAVVEDLEESASKYGVDTGPLMKANLWIKPAPLSKMAEALHKEGESGNWAIGQLNTPAGKSSQIAISIHNSKPEYYFDKGMNKEHSFYYDTGRGHRQTQETITITGMITIDKDGDVKPSGKVNMNARTTLMVFK